MIYLLIFYMVGSSRGLGLRIFIPATRIRIPYRVQSHSHKVNLGLKYNRVLLGKIIMDRGGCRLSGDSLIPVHGFRKRSFRFSQRQSVEVCQIVSWFCLPWNCNNGFIMEA